MRRAVHLVIAIAVLWCGLHLSPAEVDLPTPIGAYAFAQSDHGDAGDHARPHMSHGCHSHCPVATDPASRAIMSEPRLERTIFFANPRLRLPSLAIAPPIEPPSA